MSNRRNSVGVREQLRFGNFTESDRESVAHTLIEDFEPRGKPAPTDHQPGSLEKIKVLQKRVLKGQPLFVEGDAIIAHKLRREDEFTGKIFYTPIQFQRQSCLDSY